MQKTFTVDFLTKKHKVNEGEVSQFYVKGNHDAIIPPPEFDKVQAELARRKSIGRGYSGGSIFASRLVCGDCGGYYGQKVWHSNDPYRKVIWRCNRKYGKGEKGGTPTLTEEVIKALFLKAYNLLMADRESIAEDCQVLSDMSGDTTAFDKKIAAAQKEIADVVARNSAFIHSQKASGYNLAEFEKTTSAYDERYLKAKARLEKLQAERQERLARKQAVERFIEDLLKQPLVLEQWDDQLWNLLVQKMVVSGDGTVVFEFKGENRITVKMD